jgi:hypothetical protein
MVKMDTHAADSLREEKAFIVDCVTYLSCVDFLICHWTRQHSLHHTNCNKERSRGFLYTPVAFGISGSSERRRERTTVP